MSLNGKINRTNGINGANKTNGHVPDHDATSRARLFVLSSPEQAGVSRLSQLYADYLHSKTEKSHCDHNILKIDDLAYTLASRRSHFQWRAAYVADGISSLQRIMMQPNKVVRASNHRSNSLLFVFTGQGAQHYAMGRALLHEPVFAASIQSADRYFNKCLHADWSAVGELTKPEHESRINSAKFSQPLCTVLQVALVDLCRSWGIEPAAVVGHSSGEIGKFSLSVVCEFQGLTCIKLRHTRRTR